ncbi:MAG: hypothetical protein K9G76_11280 [Bacteroidales bacterium]|nr:hypothetical protein [Bacteroidales bacterium]MCF8404976.1 hypothetical protein [Bacteroidales bacterium]
MSLKNENNIKFSIFLVGFTTLVTQIILLRYFLMIFSGNELVIGIILSNWMLITALGAYLGKKINLYPNKTGTLVLSHLLLGILPLLMALAIFYLRNIVFPPGRTINLIEIYVSSLFLLLPFCLVSGALFTLLSYHLSEIFKTDKINQVYALEAIGGIVGGLLFNFFFIFVFSPFFALKLLLVLNFIAAVVISFGLNNNLTPRVLGLLAIISAGFILTLDLNDAAFEKLFINQRVMEAEDTPYGNIVVTESGGQYNFFENGIFLFSTDNVIANEENVHYAMLQHPSPENVLLISGGISGTIEEILKYNVKSVDYLELDPALVSLGNKYSLNTTSFKKVQIVNQDARLFLKTIDKTYDVVLINLPDPAGAQINRYYTIEFFEELKQKCSGSAVVSISLSSSGNYLSSIDLQVHRAIFSTLKFMFENVIIVPGMRNYFIASDGMVTSDIESLTRIKKISTAYVNQYYLEDELISERRQKIEKEIGDEVLINYDFYPVVYYLEMKQWISKFNINLLLTAGIFLLLLVVVLPRLNIINIGLFTTGFSSTSMELILIFAFQVVYGYAYFMVGVFIMIFMIGLALGSLIVYKRVIIHPRNYSFIQYLIGILSVFTPLILVSIKNNQPLAIVIHIIFIVLIMAFGLLTGLQFTLGTRLQNLSVTKVASTAYSSDLLGAAIGALLVSAVLVPFFGLIKVCLIIGILNFIVGLVILVRVRNR